MFCLASTAALRFQPVKRPQQQSAAAAAAKAKAKAIANKLAAAPTSTITTEKPPEPPSEPPQKFAPRTTIDDWAATAEEDDWYQGEKRPRGGRKKRKKNKEAAVVEQNWDDIYDPSRPNNYEEYKQSEEKILEVREWKDLLYRHRMRRRASSDYDSSRDDRPINSKRSTSSLKERHLILTGQFAPPKAFAPPSNINEEPPPPPPPADVPDDATGDDAYARRMRLSQVPPPPPAEVRDEASGEDAYARRLRMSQPPPPTPPPNEPPAGQIARAPVRYSFPEAPVELPASEAELERQLEDESPAAEDQPRSSRPGQAGFAERLMSKYGWSKGQGLGAKGTGIINPLYAKADKRKKKSDAEGGGFATPTATGRILGGYKPKGVQAEEEGKFGPMSEVIRLEHMLDGMDVDEELTRGEGGIMQEIGEECGEKYGTVERVYIHRRSADDGGPMVFVRFVSQLSALRAVNALEGRVFGGNAIAARFWDREQFDAGHYE